MLGGAAVAATAACFALAPAASAHQSPAGCNASGSTISFDPSIPDGIFVVHRNGDRFDVGARARNDTANVCDITDATVTVTAPAPNGTPGATTTIASGLNLLAGTAQFTLPNTAPVDVDFNDGIFQAPVTVAISGITHDDASHSDSPTPIGSVGMPLVISRPQASLTVAPQLGSGNVPFDATYDYTLTNTSPENTATGQPEPELVNGAEEESVLSDDTCSPLTFTGGNTQVESPPHVDRGETWTFTCMRTFGNPGTFTNRVRVVGISNRDGRPWPETTAQSTVTAQGSDMTVSKSHAGDFPAGSTRRTYTLSATNRGNQPTSGTVTLRDSLPSGLTATAIMGNGWSCALGNLTCTRSDPLAGGASYPPVTVTVNVAANAPNQVTNTATVSGGGEVPTGNNSASDRTTITRPSPPIGDPAPEGEPPPDNRVTLGTKKRNRNGTIDLTIAVPGPGGLSADDAPKSASRGASPKPPDLLKPARATATGAGPVTLKLRPSKATKRKLKKKRSQKALVQVTFTPTGGTAASQNTSVKFKRPKKS